MTKEQFDKEVQAHVSRFIRDADAKEDARIAQKKLTKHRAKAAKTNSLNRSSMSTLLSPKDAGTKIAESIIASIETKHTTLSEGGPKAFLDAKAKLKGVGMHIHKTGFGDEYRVVHKDDKHDPDLGHFTDDLDDALHTGLSMAKDSKTRNTRGGQTTTFSQDEK